MDLSQYIGIPNHIHIIWQINEPDLIQTVQRDFLKYTAQQIKFDLLKNHQTVLAYFKSNAKEEPILQNYTIEKLWKKN